MELCSHSIVQRFIVTFDFIGYNDGCSLVCNNRLNRFSSISFSRAFAILSMRNIKCFVVRTTTIIKINNEFVWRKFNMILCRIHRDILNISFSSLSVTSANVHFDSVLSWSNSRIFLFIFSSVRLSSVCWIRFRSIFDSIQLQHSISGPKINGTELSFFAFFLLLRWTYRRFWWPFFGWNWNIYDARTIQLQWQRKKKQICGKMYRATQQFNCWLHLAQHYFDKAFDDVKPKLPSNACKIFRIFLQYFIHWHEYIA